MFLQDGEIILSKEAYMVFETRLAEKEEVTENNPALTDITVEAYMKMARVQMEMKLPTEALRYAEMAFERNHFHPEARTLLASYSPQYDRELNHEVRVFHGFTAIWRQRFMTGQYLKQIKHEVVADLEAKLAVNRLDRKVLRLKCRLVEHTHGHNTPTNTCSSTSTNSSTSPPSNAPSVMCQMIRYSQSLLQDPNFTLLETYPCSNLALLYSNLTLPLTLRPCTLVEPNPTLPESLLLLYHTLTSPYSYLALL